jgi:hypothetical protein
LRTLSSGKNSTNVAFGTAATKWRWRSWNPMGRHRQSERVRHGRDAHPLGHPAAHRGVALQDVGRPSLGKQPVPPQTGLELPRGDRSVLGSDQASVVEDVVRFDGLFDQ